MTIKFRTKLKNGFTVDSPLTPFTFPAGEAHIKGTETVEEGVHSYIADIRGHNPQDLFHLAMWMDALRNRHDEDMDNSPPAILLLPYLPGARADRSEGGAPIGAYVYAEFLNSLYFDRVISLDPHSPVMPSVVNNLTVFPFERIIRRELGDRGDTYSHPYAGVIAPDKGAVDRATRAAGVLGVPVFRAEKSRVAETGALSGFHMIDELPAEGKFLLVDDICDGGGTFIGLAEATGLPKDRLDLWVTHGVFSKGFETLLEKFDTIHTTDSYLNPLDAIFYDNVKVHAVLPYLSEEIK